MIYGNTIHECWLYMENWLFMRFDSIWDNDVIWVIDMDMIHVKCIWPYMSFVIDMMMHVRHIDFGNDMILVLNTLVYECCICLTWLKKEGKWLVVQVLAWYMLTEGGLCDIQDRPVWVTSGIHASILVYMSTEYGLCDMQDRPVWVTSRIHASILVGGPCDMQTRPVWVTSEIHASTMVGGLCDMLDSLYESPLGSMLPYAWPTLHVIWPTGPRLYEIPGQYWTKQKAITEFWKE